MSAAGSSDYERGFAEGYSRGYRDSRVQAQPAPTAPCVHGCRPGQACGSDACPNRQQITVSTACWPYGPHGI